MILSKKFKKNLNKINLIYFITLFLALLWIFISTIKSVMEKSGLSKYNFIQRNTIGFWLLISISLSLSKYFFKKYIFAIPIILSLWVIHEILWYKLYLGVTKDEGEVTFNFYRWGNIYDDGIKDIDGLSGTDLTEGIYDNNWTLSNKDALTLKYKTYFKYLNLKPGMELLDIGCGNCSWINYCRKRGIITTGLTLTKSQADFCKSKGINNIIVGDIHKNVLKTIHKKFDAITNIGAMEHFTSISLPPAKQVKKIKDYYDQVKSLIKPNSESGRYLNSYMTTNVKYSKYDSFEWTRHFYTLASSFGYGCYLTDEDIMNIYDKHDSKVIIKRDCTEDYRWIFVKNKETMANCKYKFDTPYRIYNFCVDMLTDPSAYARLFYGPTRCWSWQFGGIQPIPNPEFKDTPIRCYIYVTKINS